MSDMPINTSSFNQAYRAYAVEQGNDPTQGQMKAKEVASQTASTASLAMEGALDAAYVSPAAARLYAEQLRQRRKVNETQESDEARANATSTGEESSEAGTDLPIEGTTEGHPDRI